MLNGLGNQKEYLKTPVFSLLTEIVCNITEVTRVDQVGQMSRLDRENNVQKREIAYKTGDSRATASRIRDYFQSTRLCFNCNISICNEIRMI